MECPECGAPDRSGTFCADCGAALDASCPSCGAEVEPGSRFCTACGARVGGADRGQASRAPWILAGAAALVVLLVLFLPRTADRVPAPPPPGRAPFADGETDAAGAGRLSADMRTNADRLFNRIMRAAEQGDQAEVARFMPMAVQAYGMVEGIDDDGLYHLAILHVTNGDPAEARRTAQRILDRSRNHLLALGVAAEAAAEAGDQAAATTLWTRFLEAYPEEVGKTLPEYAHHEAMVTEYRRKARGSA